MGEASRLVDHELGEIGVETAVPPLPELGLERETVFVREGHDAEELAAFERVETIQRRGSALPARRPAAGIWRGVVSATEEKHPGRPGAMEELSTAAEHEAQVYGPETIRLRWR
jgi:hypothetical protein